MRRQIRVAERDAAGAEVTEEVTRDWKHGGSAAFSVLAQLHQSRWRGKIEPGAFSSTLFTDFHKQIVSHHVDATGCEIRIIRSRGEPLAALYNFGFRDTIYFYQSGVSPVAHFRSPGVYLHCKAMKCAIENNFDYYDLMRGNLSSYKRRFPCEIMEMQNIALYRSRFPVRMFDQVQNYIRRTRKLIM
jgi:CelD/BcsL family acetyltransferase involved in cellulose biosynthesis